MVSNTWGIQLLSVLVTGLQAELLDSYNFKKVTSVFHFLLPHSFNLTFSYIDLSSTVNVSSLLGGCKHGLEIKNRDSKIHLIALIYSENWKYGMRQLYG